MAEELPQSETLLTPPKLFLQVGAFSQWDNANSLRNRLEREVLRPIVIQSAKVSDGGKPDTARIYRVRIGPLASVEQGDQLTERVTQLGVPNAIIVVE